MQWGYTGYCLLFLIKSFCKHDRRAWDCLTYKPIDFSYLIISRSISPQYYAYMHPDVLSWICFLFINKMCYLCRS